MLKVRTFCLNLGSARKASTNLLSNLHTWNDRLCKTYSTDLKFVQQINDETIVIILKGKSFCDGGRPYNSGQSLQTPTSFPAQGLQNLTWR